MADPLSFVADDGSTVVTDTGLPVPSGPTTATPPGRPGLLYFDTTLNKLKLYTGTAWETIASS